MRNQFFTKAASYLIIGLAMVAMLSGSCKKGDGSDEEEEDNGNGYKISLKVDGVLWEFEDQYFPPYGSFVDNGVLFSGTFGATGRASSVGLQVYDTKAIVKHDYSGYVVTQTSGHNTISGAVVSFADSQLSYSTQSITNPTVHVQLTEITATTARGTFSGTLKSQNGKPDIKITDGKFYVLLKILAN